MNDPTSDTLARLATARAAVQDLFAALVEMDPATPGYAHARRCVLDAETLLHPWNWQAIDASDPEGDDQ